MHACISLKAQLNDIQIIEGHMHCNTVKASSIHLEWEMRSGVQYLEPPCFFAIFGNNCLLW